MKISMPARGKSACGGKIKIVILSTSLAFLSAGCSLFGGGPVAAGVAKSVNGGADWQFSNSVTAPAAGSLNQSNIAKLAFDPQNRQIVYAGSYTDGLYKSEDSGASWSRVLSKISVYDFAVSPADSKTIYVSGIFSGQGKVLKTMDGGLSWQDIYNQAGNSSAIYNQAGSSGTVRAIDLNSAAPSQLIIGTASGDLIKSADGGLSWQLAKSFGDQINGVFWRGNGVYVLLQNKGLYRGSAAADNFQELTSALTKNSGLYNLFNSATYVFNQAYVDPISSNLLYVTTSHGLNKSVDGGATWTDVSLPTQQSNAGPQPIAVAQTSSNIVFTSVGPVIYKSSNGGSSWQTQTVATNGYVNYILIDPVLPQIDYAGIYVAQ